MYSNVGNIRKTSKTFILRAMNDNMDFLCSNINYKAMPSWK